MLLVQPANNVGGHADERTEGGRGPDAVLPSGPRGVEDLRYLFEIVHEEFLRLLAKCLAFPARAERLRRKQLLQFLRKRGLSDPATADAKQLYVPVQR